MKFTLTSAILAASLGLAAPLFAHGGEDHSAQGHSAQDHSGHDSTKHEDPAAMNHPDGIMHAHNAYARVNGTKSGAIFFMLHNNTETDDRLVSVSSDVAERTELHTNIADENGVQRMVPLENGIDLPWAEIHEFARGGDHIMLMGLTKPLKDGDKFTVVLHFETHEDMPVEVVVDNERKADGPEMDHSHH